MLAPSPSFPWAQVYTPSGGWPVASGGIHILLMPALIDSLLLEYDCASIYISLLTDEQELRALSPSFLWLLRDTYLTLDNGMVSGCFMSKVQAIKLPFGNVPPSFLWLLRDTYLALDTGMVSGFF